MLRTFIGTVSIFAVVILAGFFTSCQQEDSLMDTENFVLQSTNAMCDSTGTGKAGCYELVFPVTIQFADSTTATVGSYEELKLALRDWFQANGGQPGNGGHGHHGGPGHHGGGLSTPPTFVLPIQVINEAGEIITIETIEELRDIRALCHPGGNGGGNGGNGFTPCFTINYPVTVMFADSSVVTVNSREELKEATHAWHLNNPDQRPHPQFVFPITVTLADGTIVTVNSKEELRALKNECRG